jgi:hypothetical protein
MSIQYLIMSRIQSHLEAILRDGYTIFDSTRVHTIQIGPLQGDPDPDEARIFIELFENDPDKIVNGATTGMDGDWSDNVDEIECGDGDNVHQTWNRRFTLKWRCLFDKTREAMEEGQEIASTIKSRIEHELPKISFSGLIDDGEYVSRRILSTAVKSEKLQSGGPPDSYDFRGKIRFELQTTTGGVI